MLLSSSNVYRQKGVKTFRPRLSSVVLVIKLSFVFSRLSMSHFSSFLEISWLILSITYQTFSITKPCVSLPNEVFERIEINDLSLHCRKTLNCSLGTAELTCDTSNLPLKLLPLKHFFISLEDSSYRQSVACYFGHQSVIKNSFHDKTLSKLSLPILREWNGLGSNIFLLAVVAVRTPWQWQPYDQFLFTFFYLFF